MAIIRILCPTVHDFLPKTLSSNTNVHRKRHTVGHSQTMQIPIRVSTVCLRGVILNLKKMTSQSTKMFSANSNGRKFILSVVKYNPQSNSLTTLASKQKDIYSPFVIRL